MKDILSIMQETENVLFNGAKIPHGISHPVIRIENGKYYLAAFAYVYNKTNLEEHTLYRPSRWITMDLESGETVEINVCEQKDFSTAPFDKLYDLSDFEEVKVESEKIKELYAVLDDIRKAYIEEGANVLPDVIKYLGEICLITPKEYRRFYKELVNI